MRVSIVDLGTVAPGTTEKEGLADSLAIARSADALGFHRIWFAEHHAAPMGASHHPEVLIAAAGMQTERIRVGSGAVLMNHYSPFKVAEMFKQLEALLPGRIDLGMGRATGGPVVDLALQRDRSAPAHSDHQAQVLETLAWLYRAFPVDHPFSGTSLVDSVEEIPQTWLLGSSSGGSNLAASLGIGYTFAGFINPQAAAPALRNYQECFRPQGFGLESPRSILAVNVTVSDSADRAQHVVGSAKCFYERLGRGDLKSLLPSADVAASELSPQARAEPTVVVDGRWPRFVAGDSRQVQATLTQMLEESGADEIMVQNMIADPQERMRSHELLAEMFELR